MSLTLLVFLPLLFAIVIPFLPNCSKTLHGFAALASGGLLAYSIWLFTGSANTGHVLSESFAWLPQFGIALKFGADNISWVLTLLTTALVFLAILASFSSIEKRLKLYYSMIFVLTASILGVFLSRDLFVYFLFWELELIPMYLLIAIWGGPRRDYAALKFVLYTLFGSVFMLAAILGLFFFQQKTGQPSFDFAVLSQAHLNGLQLTSQVLIFLGLFTAFAIKLPMVPFHTWLPDAHVEAPTPISMLLAGVLLKMGSYGMLRFCFGWFPEAAMILAPYLVLIGTINIVYTAGVAMIQSDLKKLVAYSSVSHMGFVLLGLGALNSVGYNGAVFQMISHGVVSAGLFMMVGVIYTRTHTRQIAEMGGFAKLMPTLYFFSLVICLASLGLPLLAGFPAETLVFYGAYLSMAFKAILWFGGGVLPLSIQQLTMFSAVGVVLGAAYLLWMVQRVFTGASYPKWANLTDAGRSETIVLAALTALIVYIGFFPNRISQLYDQETMKLAEPVQTRLMSQTPAIPKSKSLMTSAAISDDIVTPVSQGGRP